MFCRTFLEITNVAVRNKCSTALAVSLFLRYKCAVPVPYEAVNGIVNFKLTELTRTFLNDTLHV